MNKFNITLISNKEFIIQFSNDLFGAGFTQMQLMVKLNIS